ncbi:MAG: EAL domain-containing protein, partial [Clostridiaceae bacterium]|nr:EAL domain-containing protein [Clostridiaceae bacterium]
IENLKTNRKVLLLLLIPFVLIIFTGFDLKVILILNSVVLIHQVISAVLLNRSRQEAIRLAEDKYRRKLEQSVVEKTAELINSNQELTRLAREDDVTSLDNRRHFISELDQAIEEIRSGQKRHQIMLFYMDIDNFRSINDIYGHEAGDLLLQAVSLRLKQHLPNEGLLARLGGDEFVMSFCTDDNYSGIEPLARQLTASFHKPIYTGGYVFNISLSIGITFYPQDGKDRSELLKNADLSMYYAKEQSQGSYIFFHDIPKALINRKNEIALKLRSADYDQEFKLHYQPYIRVSDGALIGAEALLRWNNPELGNISPAEFIPIAESIGEIVKIGNWVMLQAMNQIHNWHERYGSDITVSINISPIQLDQEGFLKNLKKLLEKTGANPQQIDLEITENSAVNREERLVDVFERINETGCSISIDDFGTGYSSLSYLKRFRIHRLKIAKPLIDSIAIDEDDHEIVSAIIAMARALKLRTIAEGVEEAAQLHKLRELDCDEIQGFYFSKPLPVRDFEERYLELLTEDTVPAPQRITDVADTNY